jgi:hypothetical protein
MQTDTTIEPAAQNLEPFSAEAEAPITQANAGNTVRASWQFSLDDIRANIARYPADAQQAMVSAFLWCIDLKHPLSKPDFAHRVGASDNLIYKLYTGRYRSPSGEQMDPAPELIKSIREFLALEAQLYVAGEIDFALTPTAKRIITSCELARESRTPVIMWGPSHVGKTVALRHVATACNHGRTAMAELDAATGLGGMVRCGANALGISDKSNTAALVERMKNALKPDMLMIWDEVHLLHNTYQNKSFFKCVETIRRIYDKTQCGMILCWTDVKELMAASHGELVQIWRRGVHKVALPVMPTKADLVLVLEHNGLEFPSSEGPQKPTVFDSKTIAALNKRFDSIKDLSFSFPSTDRQDRPTEIVERPYDLLRQLAKEQGLKSITERLRYAKKIANKSREQVNWRHFVDAHLRIAREAQQEGEWH